jgi:hypothetical protein
MASQTGGADMVDGAVCAGAWWDGAQWCQIEAAWKRDVALEIWIDVEQVPTRIRLAGTLERGTAGSLVSVVQDQILEGSRDFELDTSSLYVPDEAGLSALTARAVGKRVRWSAHVGSVNDRRTTDNRCGVSADVTSIRPYGRN